MTTRAKFEPEFIEGLKHIFEERIAFNKTWLFSEGKEKPYVPLNPLVPPLAPQ